MLKLLDFKGSGGLVSGQKLMNKMQELVGNPLIEDLPITFTAVASDSKEEKEVWINKGPLLSAIRASISMPLFFTPYFCDGEYLIDGGILNPVPIAPTFHDRTDLTIAVNLGGAVDRELGIVTPQKPETTTAKIKEFFSELALPQSLSAQTGMYQIATQTIDAMQGTIARMKLAAYPPDVEIEIPRNLCATLEFNRAKELIDYGYAICDKYLEK
jgi:NTE family protein